MTDPEGLREKVAAIIAGFHEPSPKDGPATLRLWVAAIRKADAILAWVNECADAIISGPLQDRVGELEEALRKIARDGQGLQGILEDHPGDTKARARAEASYWQAETRWRRGFARSILSKPSQDAEP